MALFDSWMRWKGKTLRSVRSRGLGRTIRMVPAVLGGTAGAFLADIYRYFSFPPGAFRGVHRSFIEAEEHAPRGARVGFDFPAVGRAYVEELVLRAESADYPVMFHLNRVLRPQSTVLDFGGNVGIHFRRYSNYLDLRRVQWIVCEVPAICQAGEEACAGIPNLSFVSDIAEIAAPRIDVLVTSGALQYVDEPPEFPARRLCAMGLRPRHILINKLPLYDGPRFVTLQNAGSFCCPHSIFNRGEFMRAMGDLRYELLDEWDDTDSCVIPFHPERSVRLFTGLLFADGLNPG